MNLNQDKLHFVKLNLINNLNFLNVLDTIKVTVNLNAIIGLFIAPPIISKLRRSSVNQESLIQYSEFTLNGIFYSTIQTGRSI